MRQPPWDGTGVPPTGMGRARTIGVIVYPDGLPEEPGVAEYPDGTTTSVLEDRSEDFPDEMAEATEVIAEPIEPVFDPGEYTVAEVQAYLADHPDETDAVLDRERAGKARVTLLNKEN